MSECSQNEFREISNAAERFFKNPTSTMALRRFCEKLRELQHRWIEFKTRYEEIVKTNQSLNLKCEDERTKCKSYKTQLRRIKENQENVAKLRSVYDNIKKLEKVMYSEVEVQTDETADDLVNKATLTAARVTLDSIRAMVVQREGRLDENLKMIAALNERISSLEKQNFQLYIMLRNRDLELENQEDEARVDETPRRDYRLSVVNLPIAELKSGIPKTNVKSIYGRSAKSITSNARSSIAAPSSLARGDCKEVATLKKIRTELDRKQAFLKQKIDRFNLRLGS